MDHGDWPTDKSDIPAFGDPLLCEKPDPTKDSECPNRWIERASSYETKGLEERDPSGLSFRELIAGLCKSAGVSKCRTSSRCQIERQQLDKNLPKCQWKSFRDWMLETLACCSIRDSYLDLPEPVFRCICTAQNPRVREQIRPGGDLDVEFEVFRMLFWIGKSRHSTIIAFGYRQLAPGLFLPHTVRPVIVRVVHEANAFKICPNRLWNIASASPCGEADIPTLVEAISWADHKESFQQLKHIDCTPDFCEIACENATLKQQLHKCKNAECTSILNEDAEIKSNAKRLRSFPQDMVLSAINKDKPAIWKIGEEPKLSGTQGNYIAISHVWSDGTGVGVQEAGEVNPCLFDYFKDIAAELGCNGVWWDTISIPTDRKARARALNGMQRVFANANWTVVHDEFLVQFPWSDDGLPCIAVILSSWFTRGWTALELFFSPRVKIIFKDGKTDSRVLKDLDKDILAPHARPCPDASLEHWIATEAVLQFRDRPDPAFDRGEFLHSLALRTTSWPRDRAVIAALMAGVKTLEPGMTQAEITRRTVTRLIRLSSNFLFHGFPTMTDQGSFSWCPHSLFSGQRFIGSTSGDGTRGDLQSVGEDGEIQGHWRASVLNEAVANDIKPRSFHFSVDLRIKHALQRWESCLLIDLRFSPQNEEWKRNRVFDADKLCILVVVLGCEESTSLGNPILDCQYIGCVYEPSHLEESDDITVRFGKIGGRSAVNATEMLRAYGTGRGSQTKHLRPEFS